MNKNLLFLLLLSFFLFCCGGNKSSENNKQEDVLSGISEEETMKAISENEEYEDDEDDEDDEEYDVLVESDIDLSEKSENGEDGEDGEDLAIYEKHYNNYEETTDCENGVVVYKGSSDFFIIETRRGYTVLETYSGFLSEGDQIRGELNK